MLMSAGGVPGSRRHRVDSELIRLLLVEDNAGDARLIREMLRESADIEIETVEQVSAAVDRLGRGGLDLVLLDLGLPDSQGLDTLRTVGTAAPRLPIVVLTGHDDAESGMAAVRAGAQDYLIKGQIPAGLLHRVLRFSVERQRVQEALLESEDRYRDLVENSQELICTHDLEGRILSANPWAAKVLGYGLDTILHMNIRDFLAPETRGGIGAYLARIQKRGVAKGQLLIQTATGERRLWEYHNTLRTEDVAVPVVRGMAHDITERKQAEDALRTSRAQFSHALQMARAGHWEYDVGTDTFTFNDNFYRIFRTTAAEVGGYRMSSAEYARRFCHPDDAGLVAKEVQAAIATPDPAYSCQIEHRILHADGEVGHITVRFFIVKDSQGRTVKTYGVNQDITERKQAERRIAAALVEKEALLREIHHRVKNNLQAVTALIDISRAQVADAGVRRSLRELQEQVRTMALVHEHLYRSENLAEVEMQPFLDTLAENVLQAFGAGGLVVVSVRVDGVSMDLEEAMPCGLIVNELVTNALKHAFAGGTGEAGAVTVSLASSGDEWELRVTDNGIGLPPGFDWRRAESMGLHLVNLWATHQLGGIIDVSVSEGTAFTIRFGRKRRARHD
ncbi:PAS domain S-box protein [Candidatus Fermentibacteria bacterium]|nr:PAS domain S-box protein [Candidatus Fermentibacteria bacterium]